MLSTNFSRAREPSELMRVRPKNRSGRRMGPWGFSCGGSRRCLSTGDWFNLPHVFVPRSGLAFYDGTWNSTELRPGDDAAVSGADESRDDSYWRLAIISSRNRHSTRLQFATKHTETAP